jgi:hypothetical protein
MLFQLPSTAFLRGKYFKNHRFSGLGKFLREALLVFESDRPTSQRALRSHIKRANQNLKTTHYEVIG